jgi:hypothetical protein
MAVRPRSACFPTAPDEVVVVVGQPPGMWGAAKNPILGPKARTRVHVVVDVVVVLNGRQRIVVMFSGGGLEFLQVLGQRLAWHGRGRGRGLLAYPPCKVTYEPAKGAGQHAGNNRC